MEDKNIEVIARGIIEDSTKTKILFCSPKSKAYYYLPGGHVEFLEKSEVALAREILEETGMQTKSSQYHFVGSDENIFMQNDTVHHEINLYFTAEEGIFKTDEIVSHEDGILFSWINKEDIPNLSIFPESIKCSHSVLDAESRK